MSVRPEFSAPQPVFGMALGSHLERSCRDIASVLEDCVSALLDYGMDEEVWRIAYTRARTHTHPFNGPLSGATRVSWYQKGKNQSGFN